MSKLFGRSEAVGRTDPRYRDTRRYNFINYGPSHGRARAKPMKEASQALGCGLGP